MKNEADMSLESAGNGRRKRLSPFVRCLVNERLDENRNMRSMSDLLVLVASSSE